MGIVYNNNIYSRHEIPLELTDKQGKYRLNYVNCGYYDGHVFSGNVKNRDTLAEYLQYLNVLKNGGGNNGALGHVASEFVELNVNGTPTGDYFWRGTEQNLVLLPDTREELKLYLNCVAYQTLPSN